jgi:hypothetical protein
MSANAVAQPSRAERIAAAIAIGLTCGAVSFGATRLPGFKDQDFHAVWLAAQAVLSGGNPYDTVWLGPYHGFTHPLPMALVTIPLAPLPSVLAGSLMIAVVCGVLAYAVTSVAWWPLLMFTSGSMAISVITAQWSPLLMIALVIPSLGWIAVLKPNIGLGIFAYRPSLRTAIIVAAILVASLFARPSWPIEWIRAVRDSPLHFAVWKAPGGFVVLSAVIKWRRPEGRLLTVLSLVPTSPIVYEALPLFVIPRSRHEMMLLALTSQIAFVLTMAKSYVDEHDAYLAVARPAMLLLIYLPALVMVLRRPNEGNVPAWLERATTRLPAWLRGRRVSQPAPA